MKSLFLFYKVSRLTGHLQYCAFACSIFRVYQPG
jgi:hypothetical protein